MRLTIVVLLSCLEDIRDHILFIFLNFKSVCLNLKIYHGHAILSWILEKF